MSEEITPEIRTRALILLDRQKQNQRQAEKERLAASATVGDLEASQNRISSAILKLETAINRLRTTQIAVLQELQELNAEADHNSVEVQYNYGQSTPAMETRRYRRRQRR